MQCRQKMSGTSENFRWLGPDVWWEISQIYIEYIKPIRQMSDEPWKFFAYTDNWIFTFPISIHFSELKLYFPISRDFYLPKFQDIVQLKFWKSWTFPKFRRISVYIDVNFICLWYTWGQNVLLQNSATKNLDYLFVEKQKLVRSWYDVVFIWYILRTHTKKFLQVIISAQLSFSKIMKIIFIICFSIYLFFIIHRNVCVSHEWACACFPINGAWMHVWCHLWQMWVIFMRWEVFDWMFYTLKPDNSVNF